MTVAKHNIIKAIAVVVLIYAGVLMAYAGHEKEFKKNIVLPADAMVTIENVNGDITIESWDKNEINIYAKIRAESVAALNYVTIEVTQNQNYLNIKTKYNKGEDDDFWTWIKNISRHIGHSGHSNVDYYIKAPMKVNFKSVENVNGDILVKKIAGIVNAETVNGKIELYDLTSRVNAETVNGSIEITVNALTDDVRCETVNGSIKVLLPAHANAHLSAQNINGSIKSDFPVTVNERIAHKTLDADIGKSGKLVDLETVNGSISILKLEQKATAEKE